MSTSSPERIRKLARRIWMRFLLTVRVRPISVGKEFRCGWSTYIRPRSVRAGDYVFVGPHAFLAAHMEIGNFVLLAGKVSVVGGDHLFDIPGSPIRMTGRDVDKPVVIDDDVWVGHRATIMHGVHIGEGAIVGAGAVVVKDVPAYTVVAGVPARTIRSRFESPEDVEFHKACLQAYRETGVLPPRHPAGSASAD